MIEFSRKYLEIAHGSWDYFRHPEYRNPWGGPFNNQLARQALFQALIAAFRPWTIVETGTYRGSTTEYFAAIGLPVFTAEANHHAFGFALMRLWRRRNVNMLHGDSRAMLRSLLAGPSWNSRGGNPLFYLDAHWEQDLPLAEEIDIVFSAATDAIVIIDDYEVPGDAGYGFDDYGPGKALDADYIKPSVDAHGLAMFYPSTPSENETGVKRGCVVLAKAKAHGDRLASLPLLRPA